MSGRLGSVMMMPLELAAMALSLSLSSSSTSLRPVTSQADHDAAHAGVFRHIRAHGLEVAPGAVFVPHA
ncbi:MAG: hypothetical protein CYG60_23905 [Actinobacteria bacterium]|nr:MAG: hypothetical protein CYG60_23905 [Actinomycetota bacterium]